MPVLGTLVVAFLLALVALIAIGPLNHNHPILGRFFAEPSPAEDQTLAQAATAPTEQSPPTSDNADAAVSADSSDQRGSSIPKPSDVASSAKPAVPAGDQPADAGAGAPTDNGGCWFRSSAAHATGSRSRRCQRGGFASRRMPAAADSHRYE